MAEINWIVLRSLRLFVFNVTATTATYSLSLHDALPISCSAVTVTPGRTPPVESTIFPVMVASCAIAAAGNTHRRSEEHTSELQSHVNLVCRLLLEKKRASHIFAQHVAVPPYCGETTGLG